MIGELNKGRTSFIQTLPADITRDKARINPFTLLMMGNFRKCKYPKYYYFRSKLGGYMGFIHDPEVISINGIRDREGESARLPK